MSCANHNGNPPVVLSLEPVTMEEARCLFHADLS